MRYFPLIWTGLWQKRSRTALMLLQIIVTFLLFGLLQGTSSGISHAIGDLRANLYVVTAVEQGGRLPLSLGNRIADIKGVYGVYPANTFSSTYQHPSQRILVVATDINAGRAADLGIVVSQKALSDMRLTRTGVLVSEKLAERYGWKIGDHIPLRSNVTKKDGTSDWGLDVVGTFTVTSTIVDRVVIMNNSLFDEARASQRNTVKAFLVELAEVGAGARIAREIDVLSINSSFQTRTESVQAMAQSDVKSLADLNFIVRAIVGAAMFALLVSVAAMMTQSIRERTVEFAVLKTIGFSDAHLFLMLQAEASILTVGATALGLAGAFGIIPLVNEMIGVDLAIPPTVVLAGLGIAATLSLSTSALPVRHTLRLQVAEALAPR